jgi:lipid A 4'-phosphatase
MFLGISKWFYIFALCVSLLFIIFPEIDLITSSLFYSSQKGWFWSQNSFILFLYAIPRPITIAGIVMLILLVVDLILKKRLFNIQPRSLFFFSIVMLLGPGLIVHNILKDNWERARPIHITQFDGIEHFTPAFVISDQDGDSFSSGHAAGAYALIALALLVKRRQNFALILAIIIGSLVGFGRIVQGGHYLSDVFVSFVIVYLTAKILYYFVFTKDLVSFIDRRCPLQGKQ